MARGFRLTRIVSLADKIADQVHGLHFASFHPPAASWRPAVNVYAHATGLEVCMELAGVPKQDIQVDVGPRRLVIRGSRAMPANGEAGAACRLMIMEIHDGSFERVLEFSMDIDPDKVSARQDNGWLWVSLPFAAGGGEEGSGHE